MVEGKDAEKINTGTFFTSYENAKDEEILYTIHRNRAEMSGRETARIRVSSFQKTADKFWKNKLVRNTAVCAVAALVIWGIASSGTPAGQQASNTIRGVIEYQTNLEKDLGDLKFVDSALDEDTALVLANEAPASPSVIAQAEAKADAQADSKAAAAPSAKAGAVSTAAPDAAADTSVSAQVKSEGLPYPLDGIVTTTFAQSKSGVIITATDSTQVKSIKAGKVSKTSENYMVIQNGDSSVTTYYGVAASVKKGDSVQAGQEIGKLLSQTLYVEQSVNGEKTDPLT
ncbi:MAG: M23 family metallopeptidase [Eubacteriales bacterium]